MTTSTSTVTSEYCSEVLFVIKDFRTDMLLYRERAALLLPDKDQRNSFIISHDGNEVRFFIKSTTLAGLSYMKAFFSKLYLCNFERQDPPQIDALRILVIRPSLRNFRGKQKYSAGFVRTLTQGLASVRDLNYQAEVIIETSRPVSARRRNYGFSIRIQLSGDPINFDPAISVIRESLRQMREDHGLVLKLNESKKFRLLRNLLKDPFQLSSVVRIPEDESLVPSSPAS